ncbi:MarR family transcriptional regulator [Candidatus Poriferisocius sp.]|uniref:MarR family transcriptional regulator n=1 Tax=Candidatus Poriferisocius sp. TaxID=3101276 RepID=UPI003B014098
MLPFDPISEARRNWEANDWRAIDAMSAATSITRAHQLVIGRINEALAPFELTFSRFEALALLHFSRRGSLPLGKMGNRLMVHPTSVTNAIDRLERDGLVRRVPHTEDRRTVLAEITDEGRRVVAKAADALADIEFGLASLSAGTLGALDDAIRTLRRDAGDFAE